MDVIQKHLEAFTKLIDPETPYDCLVSEGSTRSGKTYGMIQLLLSQIITSKEKIDIAFCRHASATIKRSTWQDILTVIGNDLFYYGLEINRTEMTVTYPPTGSRMFSLGLNDAAKVHGVSCDYALIDEATEVNEDAFRQIEMRTRRSTILCYNPSVTKHWIYDTVITRDRTLFLHSTYKDNLFLDKKTIVGIEAFEPTPFNIKQGTSNKFLWRVYGQGLRGVREGAVFPTQFVETKLWPSQTYTDKIYGLDFGFSNDPTALTEILTFENKTYAKTLLFERGLIAASEDPNVEKTIVRRFKQKGVSKEHPIICDNARPEIIETLRQAGYQAIGCVKGPGSIMSGIQILSSMKIYVPAGDPILHEAENYLWATDKNGVALSPAKPCDAFNHCMDGLRYVFTYRKTFGGGVLREGASINEAPRVSRVGQIYKQRQGNKYMNGNSSRGRRR